MSLALPVHSGVRPVAPGAGRNRGRRRSPGGEDRAAIRIDTVATALKDELPAAETDGLALTYAPPVSSV